MDAVECWEPMPACTKLAVLARRPSERSTERSTERLQRCEASFEGNLRHRSICSCQYVARSLKQETLAEAVRRFENCGLEDAIEVKPREIGTPRNCLGTH
jgi:hypothetical protein